MWGMNALDRCAWVAVLQLRHWAYREGRPRGDLLSLDRAIRVFIQLSRDTAVADVVQVMSSSNKAAVTAVTKQQQQAAIKQRKQRPITTSTSSNDPCRPFLLSTSGSR